MSEDSFYLIPRSHLPDAIRKAVDVTELLQQRPALSVSEAVRTVGLSRSAYYKYKDVVRPFFKSVHGQIVTLALTLRHTAGVLSDVLNLMASRRANILTINQSLPLQGLATVIVSMETRDMQEDLDDMVIALRAMHGVEAVTVVGQS